MTFTLTLNGNKTLIFSLLVTVLGVLQSFDWVNVLGTERAGYVVTAIGIITAILRVLTTGPSSLTPVSLISGSAGSLTVASTPTTTDTTK